MQYTHVAVLSMLYAIWSSLLFSKRKEQAMLECVLLNVQWYTIHACSWREMVESVLQYINIIQK